MELKCNSDLLEDASFVERLDRVTFEVALRIEEKGKRDFYGKKNLT